MTNQKRCGIISKSPEIIDFCAAMAQSVEHVIGNDEVISSILISSSNFRRQHAAMAQSVEHVIGNDEVISSILISSSIDPPVFSIGGFFVFCTKWTRGERTSRLKGRIF